MMMRARRFLPAACIVGSLCTCAQANPPRDPPRDIAETLETGTVVTVTPKRTVGAFLDAIRKRYRVGVQVVDEYGKKNAKLRALASTVQAKKEPFWEVLRRVLKEADLKLASIDKGQLTIARKYIGDDQVVPGGDTVTAGSFLAVPIYHAFFKRPELQLWPEPWLAGFSIVDVRASLTLPDGGVVDYKPGGVHTTGPDGAVTIPLRAKIDEGVKNATRVELSAVVRVPTNERLTASGTLSTLIPEATKVGDASVRVSEFREVESKDGKGKRLRLRFEVEGALLARDDVSIARGKEDPLKPSHFETSDGKERQQVDVEFDAGGKSRLDGYTLNMSLPRPGVFELGVLDEIGDKKLTAGLAKVTLFRVRQGDFYVVVLKCDDAVIPSGEVFLTSPRGKKVVPSSHRGYTRGGRQNVDLEFEKHQIKGDILKHTLHVMAPGKKTPASLKKIAKLVPETLKAGQSSIVVLGFGEEPDVAGGTAFALRLSIEGTRLAPGMIRLLDARRRPLTSRGSLDATSTPQLLTLTYPSGAVKGSSRSRGRPKPIDLRRFRLEIDAPGGLIEHTIRATMTDVSLADPRR